MKGRQRGRNGGKPRMHHQGGGGGGRNPNFDHNAGRMRGNAQQLLDKYLALGRDASSQGDRVLAENYFQHADHYYRVVNARFEGQQNQNQHQNQHQNQQRRFNGGQGGDENQDNQGNYQGNYTDFNRTDMQPGPSQNLIPAHAQSVDQPSQQPPQQQGYNQNYQPQPQHQPAPREPEGDIGLPPQLFGEQPQHNDAQPINGGQQGPDAGQGQGRGNGEERGFRPRHSGRRRFSGKRDQASQAEPTGEPT